MKAKKTHLPYLLAFTLLWGIFFAPLLFGTGRLPSGDFAGQFHAFAQFQLRQLQAGHLPLWSGGSFAGFPFAADVQTAVFYPIRWLTLLVALPNGFSYHLLTLEGLFHIWLAGVFTYLLAFSITKHQLAALLGAVAFSLGGYLTAYPLLQLAILETICWLPLILWLLRQAIVETKRPFPYLIASAIVLGVAFLAGHPQTFLHIGYITAVYFLFLTAQANWAWRWRIGLGVGLTAVTFGIAMISALPAWHYLSQTTRSDVGYDFVSQGFPLLNYIHLLLPRTLSLWTPEYVGLATITLAFFALWGRRRTEQSAEILFWGVLAGVSAWLSLGDKGILFELMYRLAPGFTLFRQQERLVNVVSLSTALLGAQGLALWLRLTLFERRQLLRRLAPLILGGMVLFTIILVQVDPIRNDDWLETLARQWVWITAVFSLLYFSRRQWAGWTIVLLLAADLFLPIRTAMNIQPVAPDPFWQEPDWVAEVQAVGGRLDSRLLFHANIGELYNLEDVRGISPLKLDLVEQFEQLPRDLRWQLLNVTHIIAPEPLEADLTAVHAITENIMPDESFPSATLYQVNNTLPRAWMSYKPIITSDEDTAFEALHTETFEPSQQVVLTNPPNVDELAAVSPPDVVPVVAGQHGQFAVKTAVSGILVVSEWHIDGWQAELDGEPIAPLVANGGLLGFMIPAGEHQLSLRYVPPGLQTGAIVTAVTLFISLILAWQWNPQPKRQLSTTNYQLPITNHQSPISNPQSLITFIHQHWHLIIAAVTLLGFALRVATLGVQELRGDEAFSYLNGRLPFAEIIPSLIAQGDPHSPLHYLLLHGWMRLAGDSEFSMRFVSLIPSVLLLPVLAQIGRRLGGRSMAVWLALLVAISQSQIWLGQDVRNQYTLSLFFVSSATLLLMVLLERGEKRPFSWLFYALLCALAVYAHFYSAFALLGHVAFVWLNPKHRDQMGRWAVAVAVAALLFVPWVFLLTQNLLSAGQLSDPSSPELANYLTVVGIELLAGSAVAGGWLRWLFLAGLALCLLGWRTLWQGQKAAAGMLGLWLLATTLVVYLIRFQRATFNPFYISVAAPAWWLLLTLGLKTVWESGRRFGRETAVLLTTILLFTSLNAVGNYLSVEKYSRSLGYRPMAEHVAQEMESGDLFLAHFPDPAFVYYLRHLEINYAMQPAYFQPPVAETEAEVAKLLAENGRIWFVPAPGSAWDADNVVPRWLSLNAIREEEALYDELTLLAYRNPAQFSAISDPLGVQLGDQIVLEAAYVTLDGEPVNGRVVTPSGRELAVTLVWRGETAVSEHYTVFVQVLDENGVLVVQDDGVPAQGLRPTTTWPTNALIVDEHRLTLPSGRLIADGQIIVGMYKTETVERLTFDTGADALAVRGIEVYGR